MGRLDGKVAVITGGAAGIGQTVAKTFAREGAIVVIFDCDHYKNMDETIADITATGATVLGVRGDVTSVTDVENAMKVAVEQFGKIDVLVNDAGVGDYHYPITRTSDELWQNVCSVNQTGVFNCSREALKYMEAAGSGSIVNVSSIGGVFASAGVAYSASKAAVIGITKNIAIQFAGKGIRCNAVCPGPTEWTGMNYPPEVREALDQEMREITGNHWDKTTPWTKLEDQANAMLFFASDESKAINGQYIVVDNGKTL